MSGACFSADRRYRYALWRRWNTGPALGGICLLPLGGDEQHSDAHVNAFATYAREDTYGGIEICTLFAITGTDWKKALRGKARDDVDNNARTDRHIASLLQRIPTVVVAYGDYAERPRLRYRIERLRAICDAIENVPSLQCFGYSDDGRPIPPTKAHARTHLRPFHFE